MLRYFAQICLQIFHIFSLQIIMCRSLQSKATVQNASFIQFRTFILQKNPAIINYYMIINVYEKFADKYIKILSKYEKFAETPLYLVHLLRCILVLLVQEARGGDRLLGLRDPQELLLVHLEENRKT